MTATPQQGDEWTVGRLLNWTSDYFAQQGFESPRLEAEVLLAHARGCQRIMLYTAFEEVADETLRGRFRELVRRRTAGEPFAYLAGKREFFSLEFDVTPDVLIPRPETEQLVMAVLDWAKLRDGRPLQIIDIGTGSGIVAVCLAKQLESAQLTAVDVSPQALAVAERNAAKHGVIERIRLLESDLFAQLGDATFDAIVSNPPYIATSELATLDAGVRDHEPAVALDGGADGTSVIERLVAAAAQRLRPGGLLAMEISPMIADRVQRLLAESPLEPLPLLKDLAGHQRVAQAQLPT